MDSNFERTSDTAGGFAANSIPPDPPGPPHEHSDSAREPVRMSDRSAKPKKDGGRSGSLRKTSMNDRAVACDLLLSAKAGVKAYADAITEADTPMVRSLLKRQLNETIAFQDQIGAYLAKKGWYNAYNMNQQILIDLDQTQEVLNQLQ